jgi:hypothetical protein
MATSTVRRPRVKPVRTLRLLAPGLVRVTEGKAADVYTVRRIPADFGDAFEVAATASCATSSAPAA